MDTRAIVNHLARLEKNRTSLYLSSEKMEHWYLQNVSQVLELRTGEVTSGKLEAGLLGILKSEVGGDTSRESKVAIDNVIVQGVVAENVARASKALVDLSSTEPKKGALCYFLGEAHITLMNAAISPETTGLSARECSTIADVRNDQETCLKLFEPTAATIVLTFRTNGRAFASIGSLKPVRPNALSSYHSQKSFGILCTLESTRGEVSFLDPLWIWHE